LAQNLVKYCRDRLPAKHPFQLAAANNQANVYLEQGKFAEAERLYRGVIKSAATIMPEHREALIFQVNLARALLEQGKLAEAEKTARAVLPAQRRDLGDKHPQTALNLSLLGEILVRRGRPQAAESLLREALAVQRQALQKGHAQTAYTETVLGDCLTALGHYPEAEKLLLEGYKVLVAKPRFPSFHRRTLVQRLVRLYEAWSKPAQAAEWRRKLPSPSGGEDSISRKK
jgi:tetratricopeptide (TPR) repeat protein